MKLVESWTNRTHHRIFRDGNVGASVIQCTYAPALLEVVGVYFTSDKKYQLSNKLDHETICFEEELFEVLKVIATRMKE